MDSNPQAKILRVEQLIAYTFSQKDLIWEALQQSDNGVTQKGIQALTDGNKRLAVVGDRAAELVLSSDWYQTGDPKGSYSFAQKSTTSNENLAAVARRLDLFSTLNAGTRTDLRPSDRVLGTLVEAILGAVFMDAGDSLPAVRNVLYHLGLKYDSEEVKRNAQPVPVTSKKRLER